MSTAANPSTTSSLVWSSSGQAPAGTPSHTLPGAPRLTVVRWLGLCLESQVVIGERLKSPLARLRGAILRFGQNAVKTPGRTHDNHCVTEGLKVSLKPFQRLGVAHVPEGAKPRQGCRSRAAPWSLPAGSEIPFASFRRAHFSLLTFFLKEKKKVRGFRLAIEFPANTPRWGVLRGRRQSRRVPKGSRRPSKGRRQAALKTPLAN